MTRDDDKIIAAARRRAGRAAESAMASRGWTQEELASRAEVDVQTVRGLLSGHRWPRATSRARIESALGWPAGALAAIHDGDDEAIEPSNPPVDESQEIRVNRPAHLTDAQWAERRAQAVSYISWLLRDEETDAQENGHGGERMTGELQPES